MYKACDIEGLTSASQALCTFNLCITVNLVARHLASVHVPLRVIAFSGHSML